MSGQTTAPLAETARHLGYDEIPEPVESLATALERDHHLALVAAAGSGVELVYALAALRACDPARPEVQTLIVSPTPETALLHAAAVQAVAGAGGIQSLVWDRGGVAIGPEDHPIAHLVAGPPDQLLEGVRAGRLGLSGLRLLVVDGLETLDRLGSWPATEALLDSAGPEIRKILCSANADARFLGLVSTKLPRARRWPPELLPDALAEESDRGRVPDDRRPIVWVGAAAGEAARVRALAAGLQRVAADDRHPTVVRCLDPAVALRVEAALGALGFRKADDRDEPGVRVSWGEETEPSPGTTALFGLPSGLPALRRWLEPAAHRLAVVEIAHRAQLGILTGRAGWTIRDLPTSIPAPAAAGIRGFRDRVRDAAEAEDAGPELLLLEPLLRELGSERVAAALVTLLRSQPDRSPPQEKEPRGAWTRVFVNVGRRDGAGPADLVGAITGETPAVGAQIGKIDVRDRFSLVQLDSLVADDVIAGLTGTKIRGRAVEARVDRGA